GNKSELAMGYCTLYGDMAGGLSVLADVLKTQVYTLARRLNQRRPGIPQSVLDRAPTAELKPNQRDEDDLPPYPTLDAIIAAYVEHYETPASIAGRLGLDTGDVAALIRRLDYSEYKRQQAAPGLKVSAKAFGMGRRLPIAQRYAAPAVPGDQLPRQLASIME
ncbi:MAG: NAD(+) synthase, partial [Terriglobales bacterium]